MRQGTTRGNQFAGSWGGGAEPYYEFYIVIETASWTVPTRRTRDLLADARRGPRSCEEASLIAQYDEIPRAPAHALDFAVTRRLRRENERLLEFGRCATGACVSLALSRTQAASCGIRRTSRTRAAACSAAGVQVGGQARALGLCTCCNVRMLAPRVPKKLICLVSRRWFFQTNEHKRPCRQQTTRRP